MGMSSLSWGGCCDCRSESAGSYFFPPPIVLFPRQLPNFFPSTTPGILPSNHSPQLGELVLAPYPQGPVNMDGALFSSVEEPGVSDDIGLADVEAAGRKNFFDHRTNHGDRTLGALSSVDAGGGVAAPGKGASGGGNHGMVGHDGKGAAKGASSPQARPEGAPAGPPSLDNTAACWAQALPIGAPTTNGGTCLMSGNHAGWGDHHDMPAILGTTVLSRNSSDCTQATAHSSEEDKSSLQATGKSSSQLSSSFSDSFNLCLPPPPNPPSSFPPPTLPPVPPRDLLPPVPSPSFPFSNNPSYADDGRPTTPPIPLVPVGGDSGKGKGSDLHKGKGGARDKTGGKGSDHKGKGGVGGKGSDHKGKAGSPPDHKGKGSDHKGKKHSGRRAFGGLRSVEHRGTSANR